MKFTINLYATASCLALAAAAFAADNADNSLYVRKDTWAESMLTLRAAYAAQMADTTGAKPAASAEALKAIQADPKHPLQVAWRQLTRDWPIQSGWLTHDLTHQRHLEWFLRTNFDNWLISQAIGKLSPANPALQMQLDELTKAKTPVSDPHWLNLYGTVKRDSDLQAASDSIWIQELRAGFEKQAGQLIDTKTNPDDKAWSALHAWIKRCAEKFTPAPSCTLSDEAEAIQAAAGVLPQLAASKDALLKQLSDNLPRWNAIQQALLQRDEKALDQIESLQQQIRAFRCELVRALPGAGQVLANAPLVDLPQEWASQYDVLCYDIANRKRFEQLTNETFNAQSLILPTDRDPVDVVLRRTAALLADLKAGPGAGTLADSEKQLAQLQAANDRIKPEQTGARRLLYLNLCSLRRQIAFSNPLLNFDKILFATRFRSDAGHCCDQYYGVRARSGGELLELNSPFTGQAKLRSILPESVVTRGRLKGSKLDKGSIVHPALSYDGKQILFAYVECTGSTAHEHHLDHVNRGHWNDGRCFHIFKVNVDGSNLEQLTDGTWNDFSPCWLPSGRIAFISERRGGYLRCGRACPTFTLFDMAADGSDIRCLSHHETNEWSPAVTHDGMILWTRWDYVDRHGCTAHHPWTITPDGCDPRAVHGNYSLRHKRPDMELDVRPIPDSSKYVATAAPHHGQAFGSLVLIDPRVQDDDAMAPVKRITPDVGFPESQGGTEAYATPWPLSEKYHLCVYDAGLAMRKPAAYGSEPYGLYLVDAFGNKELIYRANGLGCHNPIPLQARRTPPVIPERSNRVAADQKAEAVVGIANVYKSLKPWPEGTKIKALRVYQILPLSIASQAVSHNTGIQIPQGRDSINLARCVLGTVPVEADGSVHMIVPARRELFFQVLDEKGLAITSMRSATQFQPGEKAMCQGCHEPRLGTPAPASAQPLAMRRPPSRLTPEADGSNPFSYPRLVQSVLDRNCVACHQKNSAKAPKLDGTPTLYPISSYMNRPTTYFTSYISLAPSFGFYNYGGKDFDDPKWYVTTPGEFGARASKLYQMLAKGHHAVKLAEEDMRRITLWLDSCSLFYGVYEKEGGEAQLRGEVAKATLE